MENKMIPNLGSYPCAAPMLATGAAAGFAVLGGTLGVDVARPRTIAGTRDAGITHDSGSQTSRPPG